MAVRLAHLAIGGAALETEREDGHRPEPCRLATSAGKEILGGHVDARGLAPNGTTSR